MLSLKNISNIYFIGIGGIGMSAIARFFLSNGVKVSGYDKTPTVLTRQLEQEGAIICYVDDLAEMDKNAQLVVFTPAIPASHAQLNWYKSNGYPVVKRSDVLQIITEHTFNICIAGTHGKTSISTMVGHLLRHSGYGSHVFLGGISVNYNTNFWNEGNDVCVVEADEYDRSFLKLSPDIAVVSSMDADHLDIYGTVEKMREAFVEFTSRIKPTGLLIRKHELDALERVPIRRQQTYALTNAAAQDHDTDTCDDPDHHHDEVAPIDIYAENIVVRNGGYVFDAQIAGQTIASLELNVGGQHNIENMLVAIAIAQSLRISHDKIKAAVASYAGVKRRFEYLLNRVDDSGNRQVAIDDYAHHPEELRALLTSVKHLFPEMPVVIAFQPHLFTRTRDLAEAFAEVLSMADKVLLLPVYPAREQPIEGISSETIARHMEAKQVQCLTKNELLDWLIQYKPSLFITAGAGDIDTLLPQVKTILMQ